MKRSLIVFLTVVLIIFLSCGPAVIEKEKVVKKIKYVEPVETEPDVTAPVLKGVSFSKPKVSANENFDFIFNATDSGGSGIISIDYSLSHDGALYRYFPKDANYPDGDITFKYNFDSMDTTGDWIVNEITLIDHVGNSGYFFYRPAINASYYLKCNDSNCTVYTTTNIPVQSILLY